MNGRILGFHRRARCPKWTPASIRSLTWTIATHCPPAPKAGNRGNRGGHYTISVLPIVDFPPTRGKGVIVPPPGGRGQRIFVRKTERDEACEILEASELSSRFPHERAAADCVTGGNLVPACRVPFGMTR